MVSPNTRAILISFAVNVGVAIVNFTAAAVTGSAAMLAEAIQTLVDTTHEMFLLLGVHQAQAPADERFPYGQGKAVYFWGFIAVVCFMAGGFVAIYNGYEHVLRPEPVDFPVASYIVLTIAIGMNGYSLWVVTKQFLRTKGDVPFVTAFRTTKDPSMRLLIFENSLDVLGGSLAFIGIVLSETTGAAVFDGVASIFVGCLLVGSGLWQASRLKNLLIGQSADEAVVQGIRDLVMLQGAVSCIEELTTLLMGREYVVVNLRLQFAEGMLVQDMEAVSLYLEERILRSFPIVKRVYVKPVVPAASLLFQEALFGWPAPVTVKERVE